MEERRQRRKGEWLGGGAILHKVGLEDLSKEVTFLTGMRGMRTENIPNKGESKALRRV